MQKYRTSVGLILLLFSFWAGASTQSCGSFYRLVKPVLSYGLEIEYTIDRAPRLLADYRPHGTSEKKWATLSSAEKMKMMLRQDTNSRVNTLVRLSTAPDWLPADMDREGHGTFEATGMIFLSLESLKSAIYRMERRYGRGAAQVHVVFNRNEVKQPLSGFVSFSADRAQLRNLVLGYQKYLIDPTKLPGANITHYVLGPMSAVGARATRDLEHQIVSGRKLKNLVAGKYFLSTVLRAGIYGQGDRIGYELRQFNFDYEGLKDEADYVSRLIVEGKLDKFKRFEDSIEPEFEINARVTEEHGRDALAWLRKLDHPDLEKTNIETHMLFFIRDWKNHPILETLRAGDRLRLRSRLAQLEAQLIKDLNHVAAQNLRTKDMVNHLRVLVAKWAYESGLLEAFDSYEHSVFPRRPVIQSNSLLDAG